nr:response regulator transcription factor [Gammaproteobacteria bacterium]
MAALKTLLIVDDDEDLRATLREQLELHEEFTVVEAATAAAGLARARDGRVDLVILDVDLPDMDGREACKAMRRAGVAAPIVMLTAAATEEADQVEGLEAGANDYVAKPFKFPVLLARIRAHLRSHEASEDATFQIGPYEFRPAMKLLVGADNKKIRLTEKETSILK